MKYAITCAGILILAAILFFFQDIFPNNGKSDTDGTTTGSATPQEGGRFLLDARFIETCRTPFIERRTDLGWELHKYRQGGDLVLFTKPWATDDPQVLSAQSRHPPAAGHLVIKGRRFEMYPIADAPKGCLQSTTIDLLGDLGTVPSLITVKISDAEDTIIFSGEVAGG